jgi:hypothetical protein
MSCGDTSKSALMQVMQLGQPLQLSSSLFIFLLAQLRAAFTWRAGLPCPPLPADYCVLKAAGNSLKPRKRKHNTHTARCNNKSIAPMLANERPLAA